MRNSKREKNQKKRMSKVNHFAKQRGSGDPTRTNNFHVFFNYINYDNEDIDRILIRALNSDEIAEIQEDILNTKRVLLDQSQNQFQNLEIGNIIKFEEPYNGKYFRLILTVNNLSKKDALLLIIDFMYMNSFGEIQFIKKIGEIIYRSEDYVDIENATGTERWGAQEQEILLKERFQRVVIEKGQLQL